MGYRVLPIPEIRLAEPPVSPAETARVRSLIAALAQLDQPDFGLSPSLSGTAFAPLPGSEHAGAQILGNHGLKTAEPLVELVTMGPRALSLLLDALDDRTPTRLTLSLGRFAMWMRYSLEARGNPAIPREQAALSTLAPSNTPTWDLRSHTVTVGDVCFVILGQITGRGYQAARYQPTGGVVINSPTAAPELASAIRHIWSGSDPAQLLLDTLLTDFHTRRVPGGDGVDHSTALQSEAARRLLYYYPRETARLIAHRLQGLQVHSVHPAPGASDPHWWEALREREQANEACTGELLRAVAWSPELEVRSALEGLFRRAEDSDLLLAMLPALGSEQWDLARERLEPILVRQPREENGWYGDGYRVLVGLYAAGGVKVLPLYRRYLLQASVQRCASVCEALRQTRGELDLELLIPMLADTRASVGYEHPVRPGKNDPRLPIRVCDLAAAVLASRRPELGFELVGTKAELDAKIGMIREQLSDRGGL